MAPKRINRKENSSNNAAGFHRIKGEDAPPFRVGEPSLSRIYDTLHPPIFGFGLGSTPFLLISLLCLVTLYLTLNSISRSREYLADARTSLFIPRKKLEQELFRSELRYQARKTDRKVFKNIYVWFSGIYSYLYRSKSIRLIFSGHPDLSERVDNLRKDKYISKEGNLISIPQAMLMGAFVFLLSYLSGFFIHSVNSSLFAIGGQAFVTPHLIVGIHQTLKVVWVSTIFVSFMISINWTGRTSINPKLFLTLFERFSILVGMLVALIILFGMRSLESPITDGLIGGEFSLEVFYPFAGPFLLAFILIVFSWMFGDLVSTLDASISRSQIFNALYLLPSAFLFVLLSGLIIHLVHPFSLYADSLKMLIVFVTIITLIQTFRKDAGSYDPDEGTWIIKFGPINKSFEISTTSRIKRGVMSIIYSSFSSLSISLIPLALTTVIMLIPAFRTFPIGTFFVFFVPLFLIYFFIWYWWNERKTMETEMFYHASLLYFLTSSLSFITDSPEKDLKKYCTFIDKLNARLDKSRLLGGGFGVGGSIAVIDQYHYYSLIFRNLGKNVVTEKDIGWILSCQNMEGGFGKWRGGTSRLSSTFHALDILKEVGTLELFPKKKHINWLRKCQQSDGAFLCPMSGRKTLEHTYYAIQSLQLMDGLDRIDKNRCISWSINRWKENSKNLKSTWYLTLIFCSLDKKDKLKRLLGPGWFYHNKQAILNSRIDRNNENIFYYLSILCILYDSLENVPDDLIGEIPDKIIEFLDSWE